MSKNFVVMPSWPENQVNINPGFGEFNLSSGVRVEYYYNVVLSTLEFKLPPDFPSETMSPELGKADLEELIEFLTVIKDHMSIVNGE